MGRQFYWTKFREMLEIVEDRYVNAPNNQLALEFLDEYGVHWSMATAALENYDPPTPRHALIKDYSENTGLLGELVTDGIVIPTGVRVPSGYIELHEVIVQEEV